MGNVDRLRNKVKPFTALFWTLGIVLYLSTPDPARRPGITLPPYTNHVMLPVRWWRVGSILNQDALPPPPFPIQICYLSILLPVESIYCIIYRVQEMSLFHLSQLAQESASICESAAREERRRSARLRLSQLPELCSGENTCNQNIDKFAICLWYRVIYSVFTHKAIGFCTVVVGQERNRWYRVVQIDPLFSPTRPGGFCTLICAELYMESFGIEMGPLFSSTKNHGFCPLNRLGTDGSRDMVQKLVLCFHPQSQRRLHALQYSRLGPERL